MISVVSECPSHWHPNFPEHPLGMTLAPLTATALWTIALKVYTWFCRDREMQKRESTKIVNWLYMEDLTRGKSGVMTKFCDWVNSGSLLCEGELRKRSMVWVAWRTSIGNSSWKWKCRQIGAANRFLEITQRIQGKKTAQGGTLKDINAGVKMSHWIKWRKGI